MTQSLARGPANGQIVQQGRLGSPAQITQSQLAQLGSVAVTAVVEMDSTYRQVEAYVGMGGRSYHHQRWLQDKTANVLYSYERAVDNVVRSAYQDIIATRPKEIVRTVYVEPPRQPFLKRLISG